MAILLYLDGMEIDTHCDHTEFHLPAEVSQSCHYETTRDKDPCQ